jgi:hypothetical protein
MGRVVVSMIPKFRVTGEQAHSDRPAVWAPRMLVVPRPLLVLGLGADELGVSLREWGPWTSERWWMKWRRAVERDTVGKDFAVGDTHDPRVDRTDAH